MNFIDLLTEMREAKSLRLLSQELITMLRPVQKASREAGRLIESSPWRYLTDNATSAMPPPAQFVPNSNQPPAAGVNGNGYTNGVNGHHINGAASGYPPMVAPSHSNTRPFPPPLLPVQSLSNSSLTPNTATKQMFNGFIVPFNHSSSYGTSPVSVPLPATPLSAALGPAAQATVPIPTPVPSTPASAYGDQFFKGDVFQRADSLLNMQQAGSVNFFARR